MLTSSSVTDDRATHCLLLALPARQYMHQTIGPRPPRIPTIVAGMRPSQIYLQLPKELPL
ncbi:hypothetical protein EV182_005706, partial [Spiromyces aspiralis]